ncbi:MAG TPA: GNAT family N-acetyltransferase [Thermodesulfobacteriota bacterium]|nr:GNAT family N-acetyltransferase [Thermodesulfobacteriota bacterium]
MGITIRPWQRSDLASIRRITWESWISTYLDFIPESDLKSYFDIHYTERSLLDLFENLSMHGFIAATEGRVTGYARLFFSREENRLYVSSLYLLPECEGQGTGSRLIEAAEGYAREKGLSELWIGVMVENRRALDFYRKTGFQFVREEPFTMGKTTVSHLIGYKRVGRTTLLHQKTYATFDGGGKSLRELCLELLSEQKKSWQDLRVGYDSLGNVRERDLSCGGSSIRLQYNPGRIKSSLAAVGEIEIRERRCFLCLDRLPEGQKGIFYRNEYLILCNPIPIFPCHFIVSHLDHRLQAIAGHIGLFLRLIADFGPDWTVLYNGPKCGASAPDHLHFHASPSGQMPIEKEIDRENSFLLIKRDGGVGRYRSRDLGREVLMLEGDDPVAVESVLKEFLNGLKKVLHIVEEPMMNMAGFQKEGTWRLLIFPRRKHRPEVFFREGEDRVVISPGVIDMGGLLITPVEKDFERLDGVQVESIYREVSLDRKTVEQVIAVLG